MLVVAGRVVAVLDQKCLHSSRLLWYARNDGDGVMEKEEEDTGRHVLPPRHFSYTHKSY